MAEKRNTYITTEGGSRLAVTVRGRDWCLISFDGLLIHLSGSSSGCSRRKGEGAGVS